MSPVALNFRYAKERGEGDLTPLDTIPADFAPAKSPATEAPRSGESGVSGPWESSILSLSFSELRATYVQPLWLEVIDFMWEGVLGTAVWGGSAEHGTGESVRGRNRREGRVRSRRFVLGMTKERVQNCGQQSPLCHREGSVRYPVLSG